MERVKWFYIICLLLQENCGTASTGSDPVATALDIASKIESLSGLLSAQGGPQLSSATESLSALGPAPDTCVLTKTIENVIYQINGVQEADILTAIALALYKSILVGVLAAIGGANCPAE